MGKNQKFSVTKIDLLEGEKMYHLPLRNKNIWWCIYEMLTWKFAMSTIILTFELSLGLHTKAHIQDHALSLFSDPHTCMGFHVIYVSIWLCITAIIPCSSTFSFTSSSPLTPGLFVYVCICAFYRFPRNGQWTSSPLGDKRTIWVTGHEWRCRWKEEAST